MIGRAASTALGLLVFLPHCVLSYRLLRYRRAVPKLSAIVPPRPAHPRALPRLSAIVPARNEEGTIEDTATSLLRQDYPALEVILIDDRSTDRTGVVIARIVARHPYRVRAASVDRLPPGWLGKNHALWIGSQHARGDWLLFADADVILDPTCCRRAVAYAEAAGVDHLTLFPRFGARGFWLDAFVAFFVYTFVTRQQPYLVRDPQSDVGIGIGAFNLIRRAAYDTIGTHAAIAMRPDDDTRLGMRVKRLGLRSHILSGADLLGVEWYPSLGAAFRGMEKNMFAAFDYSVARLAAGVAFLCLAMVYPYLAVWRASGSARWPLLGAIALNSLNFAYANHREGRTATRHVPTLPVGALLCAAAAVRGAWLTLARGGIQWRDTFYPLGQLRSQTGLE